MTSEQLLDLKYLSEFCDPPEKQAAWGKYQAALEEVATTSGKPRWKIELAVETCYAKQYRSARLRKELPNVPWPTRGS